MLAKFKEGLEATLIFSFSGNTICVRIDPLYPHYVLIKQYKNGAGKSKEERIILCQSEVSKLKRKYL